MYRFSTNVQYKYKPVEIVLSLHANIDIKYP